MKLSLAIFMLTALVSVPLLGMEPHQNSTALQRLATYCKHIIGVNSQVDQKPAQKFTITNFNWETDGQQALSILKQNWARCVSSYPEYDHEVALAIFKEKQSANKSGHRLEIKVLKDNENAVLGFITYVGYQRQPGGIHICQINTDTGKPAVNCGHIELLAVDESCRRSGAATTLIHTAIEDLKKMGAKAVDINVQKTNVPAVRCYQKLGFIQYHTSDDHIFLKK